MRSPLFFAFVILFLLCSACKKEQIPTESIVSFSPLQESLLSELNDQLYPISGASADLDDAELAPLDFLGEAQVVGLGEATHGTKEFFQMKHRIFKYLVEKHHFRVFTFEMDFAESLFFDDYVTWKVEANLSTLMKNKMLFWTWKTEEVRELLEWMRIYNKDKPKEEMLRFIGVDCQFSTYNATKLVAFLVNYNENFSRIVNERLKDFQLLSSKRLYEDILDEDRDSIREDVEWVLTQIEERAEEIIELTSPDEYAIILQLAKNIVQVEQVIYSYNRDLGYNYRDDYMALNILWASDWLQAKTTFWAHNFHVADRSYFRGGGAAGHHLRATLGQDYQVIGFSFSQGFFNAVCGGLRTKLIREPPLNESINFLFHHAKTDQFIFNLRRENSKWSAWLGESKKMLNVGSIFDKGIFHYYYTIYFREEFDVIIYFDDTKNAVLL